MNTFQSQNIFNQDQSTPQHNRDSTSASFHSNASPGQSSRQHSFLQTPSNPFHQTPHLPYQHGSHQNRLSSGQKRSFSQQSSPYISSPQSFHPLFSQHQNVPLDFVTLVDDDDDDDFKMLSSCVDNDANPYQYQKQAGALLGQVNELKLQEALITREIIFVLMGYEGHYIQFSKRYNPKSINDQIEGPDFKIAKNLDISLKIITKKLIKFGKYYHGIKQFIQIYNNEKFGKIIQKFCCCVSEFLIEYHSIILQIENDFKYDLNFHLSLLDQVLHQEIADKLTHFYQISIAIHSLTAERSAMTQRELQGNFEEIIMKNSDVEPNLYFEKYDCCKGGLALRIIQARISYFNGDPIALEFLIKLFNSTSADFVKMLNQWLCEGIIDDPFDEFLIREKKVSAPFIEIFQNKSEYYWNELFLIKNDGLLDQFKNSDLQTKILNTGKYLNIFKRCTGLRNFETLKENLQPIHSLTASDLELKIDEYFQRANKMLLKLLFQGFGFTSVLNVYQSLFLLQDSYYIDNFIRKTFSELKRTKSKISVSRLQKNYDEIFKPKKVNKVNVKSSISEYLLQSQNFSITSETFYKISKELLEKNSDYAIPDKNIRGLFHKTPVTDRSSPSRGSTLVSQETNEVKDEPTITSTDLSITLPFPLNLIINQQISYQYEIMFKLMMQIKFLNKQCELNWHEITYSPIWNHQFEPRVLKWVSRCRILLSRMKIFMNEIQSYIMYDVIETNYKEIESAIRETNYNLINDKLGSSMSDSSQKQIDHFNNTILGKSTNNSIFDTKISQRQKDLKSPTQQNSKLMTVDQLISKLSDYSSTLLNHSFVTKSETLDQLNEIFEFVFQFNNYIPQFKKVLILLNVELYEKYSKEYPDKFNKPMDEVSINKRFENLSFTFLDQYNTFGELLGTFLSTIKHLGQTENKVSLELSDRLELCYPDTE